MRRGHPSNLAVLTVLTAAALFGTIGPLSRFVYGAGIEPLAFVAWRCGIGVIAAVAFVAWRATSGGSRPVDLRRLDARAARMLALACLTGLTLNICMFIAFDRITVALALLGFYTYPAMVALVGIATGRERLDRARGVALGLALVGMVAVVASQLDPASGIRFDAVGVLLCLAAAMCQTVFVLVSRDGYRTVPTDQAMTLILATSALGAVVVSVVAGQAAALSVPIAIPSTLPMLLFAGVVTAAVPSFLFLVGIRALGGTRTGILMLFEPVVGASLAAWLLAEGLAPIQVAGGVAILAAAISLQRGASTTRDDPLTTPIPVIG